MVRRFFCHIRRIRQRQEYVAVVVGGYQSSYAGGHRFNGAEFANLSDAEISVIRNEKIGYVQQEPVFLPHFTVLENILLPQAIRDGKKIEARELTIDELSNNLKEAQQLLKFCKDKLYKTDEDIQKILDKSEDI